MNTIKVRRLQQRDYQDVREVDELTQRLYRGKKWHTFSKEEKEACMPSRKKEFKINCQTSFSFVAIKNNKVVGFLLAYETLLFKNKIVIRHLAVHPDFQKQGIGKKLYNTVIRKAKTRGVEEIETGINPDNLPSIKLHQKVGFEVNAWKKAILKLSPLP